MKAIWNDQLVAEADKEELIYIEGNWYFPPGSVNKALLRNSDTPYTCPWKGDCQYFDVGNDEQWSKDNAWSYPNPIPRSIEIVKQDYTDYIAFWRDVQVVQ